MYFLKRNILDKGRTYISTIFRLYTYLKLLEHQGEWKDKYLYISGDIWVMGLNSLYFLHSRMGMKFLIKTFLPQISYRTLVHGGVVQMNP